jgi:hypothetical protein
MCEVKKKQKGIFQLLSVLDFHIGNLQVRVTVAAPSLCSPEHGKINSLCRAEIETGTTEFAPVLPERPAFLNDNIVHRTNNCAGAT